MSAPWYEDDAFWVSMTTALFDPERLASTGAEVDAIVRLTGLQPGGRVLDLCCGPGRHSLELARRGMQVTGIDRTEVYLRRARRKARREGLEPRFLRQDMREPCGIEAFEVALNLFTSFGYFEDPEDDRLVAANLFRALSPGGVLLMDTMSKEVLARRVQLRNWTELADGSFLLQESTLEQAWSWVTSRWVLIHDGEVEDWSIGHRMYAASELVALLASVGFGPIQVFGGFDGSSYDELPQRLVLVAHKPE